jgi:hypothetical protein
VRTAIELVAWLFALILVGTVAVPIFVAVREPVREWRCGRRKDALMMAAAILVGLVALVAISTVVP